jgi:hypothetical protein
MHAMQHHYYLALLLYQLHKCVVVHLLLVLSTNVNLCIIVAMFDIFHQMLVAHYVHVANTITSNHIIQVDNPIAQNIYIQNKDDKP